MVLPVLAAEVEAVLGVYIVPVVQEAAVAPVDVAPGGVERPVVGALVRPVRVGPEVQASRVEVVPGVLERQVVEAQVRLVHVGPEVRVFRVEAGLQEVQEAQGVLPVPVYQVVEVVEVCTLLP